MDCLPVPPLDVGGGSLVGPPSQTRRSPPLPGSHGDGLGRKGYLGTAIFVLLLVGVDLHHSWPLLTSIVCARWQKKLFSSTIGLSRKQFKI